MVGMRDSLGSTRASGNSSQQRTILKKTRNSSRLVVNHYNHDHHGGDYCNGIVIRQEGREKFLQDFSPAVALYGQFSVVTMTGVDAAERRD
jgi:hypothetical protein